MAKQQRFVVLDIETTGLHPGDDFILEVGALAINEDLEVLDESHVFLSYGQRAIEQMNSFVREMHEKSGLIAELSKFKPEMSPHLEADKELATFFTKHLRRESTEESEIVLVGHSVSFDHAFLKSDFKLSSSLLSHRIVDTRSIRTALETFCSVALPSFEMPHRGLADARIELDELRYMRNLVKSAFQGWREPSLLLGSFDANGSPA